MIGLGAEGDGAGGRETIRMSPRTRCIMVWALALLLIAPALALAAPEGQVTYALHFSLAPTLFEPAETPGVVSPFMILYALASSN